MLVMPVSMVLDTTESVMLMLSSLMLVSMEPTDMLLLLLMVLLLLPLVLPIPPTLEFATILLGLRFHAKLLIYSETYFSSNTLAQSCKAGCLKFCSQRKIFDLQCDIGKCTSV